MMKRSTQHIFFKPTLKYLGIWLGGLSLLLRFLASFKPEWVERFYSRGLFKCIRLSLDAIQSIIPFPSIYLVFIFLIALLLKKWFYSKAITQSQRRLLNLLLGLVNGVGWGLSAFLFLWGFNYGRIPVASFLELELKPLSEQVILNNLREVEFQLLSIRRDDLQLQDSIAFDEKVLPKNLKEETRTALENTLESLNYPSTGFPTLRTAYPKGWLWRLGAIGIYNPFTGEANVDPGLHPIDRPYVMAHEYAHAYGFGDEGICNFLAYLTSEQAGNAAIRYSGLFNYWQDLLYALRKGNKEKYRSYRASLTISLQKDLESIQRNAALYPDLIPRAWRKKYYDAYLKSQGVKSGFSSYSEVLMLIEAWKKKKAVIKDGRDN